MFSKLCGCDQLMGTELTFKKYNKIEEKSGDKEKIYEGERRQRV